MKLSKIFKSSLKLVTVFIPQGTLARVAAGIAIWAVESLVKNSKTSVDDKALAVVKGIVSKEKKKKCK